MRRALWTAAIILITCATAQAQGSLKDRPVYSPLWTGFYLGAQIGGGWANWDLSNAISIPAVGPFTAPGLPLLEFDGAGVVGGGNIGFNRQFGVYVIGVEADFNWADVEEARDFVAVGIGAGLPFTVTTTLESYGTVRGRFGVTFDKVLVYATGGFAWATSKINISSPGQLAGPFSTTDRQTHTGWTIGFGSEVMLSPNWSIGVEYKHIDLGRETYAFDFPLATVTSSTDLIIDEVTLRTKWKF